MTTYRSKLGLEFIVPVGIVLGGVGILMAYLRIWAGVAVILLAIAIILHMFLTTYYQISTDTLKVHCSFFFKKEIPVDTIQEIKETRSPISSPAASLDRIIIYYNNSGSIIISPKDKRSFIKHLIRINPDIKVNIPPN